MDSDYQSRCFENLLEERKVRALEFITGVVLIGLGIGADSQKYQTAETLLFLLGSFLCVLAVSPCYGNCCPLKKYPRSHKLLAEEIPSIPPQTISITVVP